MVKEKEKIDHDTILYLGLKRKKEKLKSEKKYLKILGVAKLHQACHDVK